MIIPVYNQGRYLPESVCSVLGQTYIDWEIIMVDDGSTDDTREIAGTFTDPRIRYIYQMNRGLSGARNTGLRNAQGEFIALLDADDTWEPDFLDVMVEALDQMPLAVGAYAGFRYVDATGQPLSTFVCRDVVPLEFRDELLKGNWLSACAVVVRAKVYREMGDFDETLRACEDYDMWLRISAKYAFVAVPKTLVTYRRLGDNMSDDIDRMVHALLMVLEKHLGPLADPVTNWTEQKQAAVATVYTTRTLGYLAQGRREESAEGLLWLLKYRPDYTYSLDLWYSLACVHQPVGLRGDFMAWQAERGEADIFGLLGLLAAHGILPSQLRTLQGQAHLALAMLNYGKRQFGSARRHLWCSLWKRPVLASQTKWIKLAMHLLPGGTYLNSLSGCTARTVRP